MSIYNNEITKQEQQDALREIESFSIINDKINEILGRKHLTHIPWAFSISINEAKQLFQIMEVYRDYEDGAQGLVLSIEELEDEPEVAYCVELDALTNWLS